MGIKPSIDVRKVFTPTTQARLNYVNRNQISDLLLDALKTPGKEIVVYGESGSGKSTLLLNKLDEIYPSHITTRCSASSTFATILLDAFDQLDHYYIDTQTSEKTGKVALEPQFLAIKASIEASLSQATSSKRILPPQLTAQRLGELIGAKGLCWVLEDFHKVPLDEKKFLSQMLKIFSDLAARYPAVRIVAVGATDTAREVVQFDREMANRVAEIHVPLMTIPELSSVLTRGSSLLNIGVGRIAPDIVGFSSGLPSVIHHLALNSCLAAGIECTAKIRKELLPDDLKKATTRYVAESSDSLKALFDAALVRKRERKYDNTRLILEALASAPIDGLTHANIRTHIQQEYRDYPASNVTTYLRQLTTDDRGSVIRQSTSGRFRFSEPVMHSYAQALLGVKSSQGGFTDFLRELLAAMFADREKRPGAQ